MSGLFWNIRGFNKPSKHMLIKEWVRKSGFQFGCLLETQVKENKAKGIIDKVFPGWSSITNYDHHRLGRIWIMWSPRVRVTPCFQSAQMITCSFLLEGMDEEFFCSFVYGFNLEDERRELWRDIKSHQDSPIIQKKAWIVFGDFNEILDEEEHSNVDIAHDTGGMRNFQEVVSYCSLVDMSYQGPRFTWNNKRDSDIICKKLDRALVNDEWMRLYPRSYCVFEAGGCSDHQRCRITFTAESMKPRKPFKLVNAVIDMPEFLPLVGNFWRGTEPLFNSTSALFRLSKKLKALKPLLQNLSKEKIGNLSKKTKEAYATLCELQTKTLDEPSQANMEAESATLTRWSLLSRLEEKVLSQRAKIHWLGVGDGNNTTFHRAAKVREVRNSIREIKKGDGTTAVTQEDIKAEAVDYFQNFLTHIPSDYCGVSSVVLKDLLNFDCSEENRNMLVGEVSAELIRKVVFSMAADKSPGPDGFTVEFFRATWGITGGDVVQAVQYFFDKGFLPKGINSTILALIPKKDEAVYMKDYRHISCCNVIY